MPEHTVKAGECLSSIAASYGFRDYRTIYDHPSNAAFRAKRPNPNLIYPGDVVVIPDPTPGGRPVATGVKNRFRVRSSRTRLRAVIVHVDDHPAGDCDYVLTVDGIERPTARTAPDGLIDVPIPPGAVAGSIALRRGTSDELTIPVTFGPLDPIDTVSGMQQRLNNLGYDSGPVDGKKGPITEAAIRRFQKDNPPLVVDGVCGEKTRAVLKAKHGH